MFVRLRTPKSPKPRILFQRMRNGTETCLLYVNAGDCSERVWVLSFFGRAYCEKTDVLIKVGSDWLTGSVSVAGIW